VVARLGLASIEEHHPAADHREGVVELEIVEDGAFGNDVFKQGPQVIECFLLHARVLRDFYRQRRKDLTGNAVTNIVAGDFLDRPEDWTPPALTYLAADVKSRLDRALNHLAYDRTDYLAEEEWNLKLAWDELQAAREQFLRGLPACSSHLRDCTRGSRLSWGRHRARPKSPGLG
jgi:hypothetical protein